MTREKATKMLMAKVECMKREISGTNGDCNHRNCDECDLCYQQGNAGEQREALNVAIKALEQPEPCEDAVSRAKVIAAILEDKIDVSLPGITGTFARDREVHNADCDRFAKIVYALPSVTPTKIVAQINFDNAKLKEIVDEAVKRFEEELEPKQKTGKWIAIDDADDIRISGKCSACGWEAHLYEDDVAGMDYCPNCGARMTEEDV